MTKHNDEIRIDGVRYKGARPMKVYRDSSGNTWLCDKDIDQALGFAEQGCWNEAYMPFDRNF
ncbi:MAG TPA: hypothetical protein ENO22_07560 [candidate division Zixibacteria bacterium]|nr:hypothetical protein [candidate division Zixibacteria bacterium]